MSNPYYRISFLSDHVLVERPAGYEVDPNRMPAFLTEMSAFCDKVSCRKVLVLGAETKVELSTLDIYDLGEQIANLHLKIAIVETHDASEDDECFLETVAFNRSSPLQFFETEDDAKHWLEVS